MGFDLESLSDATSGAIGALVSTTILYPLDTCKTKYQAEVRARHQQKYRLLSCFLSFWCHIVLLDIFIYSTICFLLNDLGVSFSVCFKWFLSSVYDICFAHT